MSLLTLEPMLCTAVDVVPVNRSSDIWAAEPKYDGWRARAERTEDGVRWMGGRNGKDYSHKLPYLDAVLEALEPGTILDGELTAGFDGWGTVQGVMTRRGAHVPTEAEPALVYVVFDILAVGVEGEVHDLRQWEWHRRRALLEGAFEGRVPHIEVSPLVECSQEGLEWALEQGYEGVVCKRRNSRWIPGRSRMWVKVKPQQTAEAVVIGVKPGEEGGRFAGGAGAFELEMLDDEGRRTGVFTRAKCGTDDIHADVAAHPDKWTDEVIEIVHHGINPASGKPRHPQVHRLRNDKAPARPARQAAAPAARAPSGASGSSGRNYGAMKDPKLMTSIMELRSGEGDAYDRCVGKGADAAVDLARAEAVARKRGLL